MQPQDNSVNDKFGPSIESRFFSVPDYSDVWASVYENKAKNANIFKETPESPENSVHSSDTESLNSFNTSARPETPSLSVDNSSINESDGILTDLENEDLLPNWD